MEALALSRKQGFIWVVKKEEFGLSAAFKKERDFNSNND